MDILYIVGEKCTNPNNNELKYSLRSIEKYGKNVDRVFISGYCPEWLSNEVIKVPYEQPYKSINGSRMSIKHKHLNMLHTFLYVLDHTDIGDEFLVSMDDHFYIREIDFNNYPYYAKLNAWGGCMLPPEEITYTEYRKCLFESAEFLRSKGLSTVNFTLHRNMHCSRKWVEECKEYLEEIISEELNIEPWVMLLNYAYTKYKFPYTIIYDLKISSSYNWYEVNSEKHEVFSTNDFRSGDELDRLVSVLYGSKSKYEK